MIRDLNNLKNKEFKEFILHKLEQQYIIPGASISDFVITLYAPPWASITIGFEEKSEATMGASSYITQKHTINIEEIYDEWAQQKEQIQDELLKEYNE